MRPPAGCLVALILIGTLACEAEQPSTPPEASARTAPAPAPLAGDAPATGSQTKAPLPAESAAPDDPLAHPAPETLTQFFAGEQDAYLDFDKHYVKSNESRHDVWFPYIDGIGGAYVGVGADQNYTLIARARSEWVFLIDIDPRVGQTHLAYRALLRKHERVEDFLANFEKDGENAALETIDTAYADLEEGERKRIRRGFQAARRTLERHLSMVATRSRDDSPTSWLSDPEAYDWMRRLYLADRVRIMPGDLTGSSSVKTIGRVCESMGLAVGVLYLSNAEEYFKYFKGDYRGNVAALPAGEGSVVLRTLYGEDWEHADSLWNYQVQNLRDFAARLGDPKLRSRNAMIKDARSEGAFAVDTGVKGVSLIGDVKRR